MNQHPLKERRQSTRMNVDTGVVVVVGGCRNSATRLNNISRNGLSFHSDQPLNFPNANLRLNIMLLGKGKKKDLFMTNVPSKVVSQHSGPANDSKIQFGVQFTNLTPWHQNQLTEFFSY